MKSSARSWTSTSSAVFEWCKPVCGAGGKCRGRRRKGFSVVLLSSVNAVIATPTHTAYATSKGAIAQMARVLAVELADIGVRVNAIAPGTVRTAMLDRLEAERPDALAKIIDRTPLGRVAEPKEIAGGIAYLLSDEASYVTGQTLFADGGRTVQNLAL